MGVINGNSLSRVAAELSRRGVTLYHACQLSDFRSYLEIGGVPSRNLLTTQGLPYTTFDTDSRDQENGVWDFVFFNLSDFGYWFAQGKNTVPNPFGPVLLGFDPTVICQAVDVSIALRSAGAQGFDRIAEGIGANDVPRLFKGADNSLVLFADALQKEFNCPQAQSPEMSCCFREKLASLSHLAYIRVDPYTFPMGTLTDIVSQVVREAGKSLRVFKRKCLGGCETRYQILLDVIGNGVRTANDLAGAIPDGSPLAGWRDQIVSNKGLSFQFKRYATYLFEGTIRDCVKERDYGSRGLPAVADRTVGLPRR